jgi:hypothetical protein
METDFKRKRDVQRIAVLRTFQRSCFSRETRFSFEIYPGASADPFWRDHEALFPLQFRFRKQHFLTLMDEMELTGKLFKCYSGKRDKRKYHHFLADLCIMVVLRRLSYPCTFHELVDIFGYPSNRISEMYYTGIDYIYFRYKKAVSLNGGCCFARNSPI